MSQIKQNLMKASEKDLKLLKMCGKEQEIYFVF